MSTELTVEARRWIEDSPLAPDVKQALLGQESFLEYAGASTKRHATFSSELDKQKNQLLAQIEAEKATIAAEKQRAQDLIDSNTTWRSNEEARFNQAVARADAAEQRLLTMTQKLKNNFDLTPAAIAQLELDKDVTAELPKVDPPPTPKAVTADELNERGMQYYRLTAQAQKLAREHRKVFGNDDDFDAEELLDFALKQKAPSLEAAWDTKYNVSAKRAELAQAAQQKQIADAVATERAKWESEAALRGQHTPSPAQRSRGSEAVARALANTDAKNTGNDMVRQQDRISKAMATYGKVRAGEIDVIPAARGV
jgi:hypothetical protein